MCCVKIKVTGPQVPWVQCVLSENQGNRAVDPLGSMCCVIQQLTRVLGLPPTPSSIFTCSSPCPQPLPQPVLPGHEEYHITISSLCLEFLIGMTKPEESFNLTRGDVGSGKARMSAGGFMVSSVLLENLQTGKSVFQRKCLATQLKWRIRVELPGRIS